MKSLHKRIAELEMELAQLRSQAVADSPQALSRLGSEGLTVWNISDLYLDSCPLFIRQLLDHLQIQIFLKKAFLHPKGREYLYVNREALKILGWTSARGKYDSEAFQDGIASSEWATMIDIETETIKAGKKSVRELQWTSPLGDEWRINKAVNLPIWQVSDDLPNATVVGFCALAQDISFQEIRNANQIYLDILLHEYGNLCANIISDITLGMRDHQNRYYLEHAIGRATVAKDIAETLLKAFDPVSSEITETVRWAITRLKELTKKWRAIRLVINSAEVRAVQDRSFSNPEVVFAVLVQLVANAEKHTDSRFRSSGVATVEVSVREALGRIVWSVINRCSRLDGKLDLSDRGRTATLGGSILGNIIRRAYKTKDPSEFISFPQALDSEHRVAILFSHPAGGS